MQAKHCWPPHVFQLEAADMPTCPAPDVPAYPACQPDMPTSLVADVEGYTQPIAKQASNIKV